MQLAGWLTKRKGLLGISKISGIQQNRIFPNTGGLEGSSSVAPTVGFGWISPALPKFESVLEKIENLGDSIFIKKVEGPLISSWLLVI
jgi:hypothetical protein